MTCNHAVGFVERIAINALSKDERVLLIRTSVTKIDTENFQLVLWQFCPLCGEKLFEAQSPSAGQRAMVARLNELNR